MNRLVFLIPFLFLGCQKFCCEFCTENFCKCNRIPKECVCPSGSCNCRFFIDKNEDNKYNYIRKHLPKWSNKNAMAHQGKDQHN